MNYTKLGRILGKSAGLAEKYSPAVRRFVKSRLGKTVAGGAVATGLGAGIVLTSERSRAKGHLRLNGIKFDAGGASVHQSSKKHGRYLHVGGGAAITVKEKPIFHAGIETRGGYAKGFGGEHETVLSSAFNTKPAAASLELQHRGTTAHRQLGYKIPPGVRFVKRTAGDLYSKQITGLDISPQTAASIPRTLKPVSTEQNGSNGKSQKFKSNFRSRIRSLYFNTQ